jgi:hypothetical protein
VAVSFIVWLGDMVFCDSADEPANEQNVKRGFENGKKRLGVCKSIKVCEPLLMPDVIKESSEDGGVNRRKSSEGTKKPDLGTLDCRKPPGGATDRIGKDANVVLDM